MDVPMDVQRALRGMGIALILGLGLAVEESRGPVLLPLEPH